MESSHGLWIIELDPKNHWYSYFNYISRFQISKYVNQFRVTQSLVLYSSQQDIPVPYILFINTEKEFSLQNTKQQWEFLGKPKTLVFPGSSRWVKDILQIDRHSFQMLSSTDSLAFVQSETHG